MNPTMLSILAKEHQNGLVEEVKKSRPLKAGQMANFDLYERLFVRAGDCLISLGRRWQGRGEPAMYANQTYPSD
jgi:hypothetical protein